MTTNDKPVCWQCRVLFPDGVWSDWYDHESEDSRDRHAEHFNRIGHEYETRDLYARPQPAAPQVPEGMIERVEAALQRIVDGHCIRRIPADPTDPDLVLAEVLAFIQGKPAPAWIRTPPAPEQPKPEWRCFQCGEVFTDSEAAALHFGTREHQSPACCIDIAEYRRMEAKEVAYAAEDSEIHHTLYAMRTQHAVELRRAEEAGYAKGLRDAEAEQPKPAGDVEAVVCLAGEPYAHGHCVELQVQIPPGTVFKNGDRLIRLAAQPAQGEASE